MMNPHDALADAGRRQGTRAGFEEAGCDEPGLDERGFDELDGHTITELTEYLEAERNPPDPSIDGSAACLRALDALQRLRLLAPQLLFADAAEEPAADDGWVQKILAGVNRVVRRVEGPTDRTGSSR